MGGSGRSWWRVSTNSSRQRSVRWELAPTRAPPRSSSGPGVAGEAASIWLRPCLLVAGVENCARYPGEAANRARMSSVWSAKEILRLLAWDLLCAVRSASGGGVGGITRLSSLSASASLSQAVSSQLVAASVGEAPNISQSLACVASLAGEAGEQVSSLPTLSSESRLTLSLTPARLGLGGTSGGRSSLRTRAHCSTWRR